MSKKCGWGLFCVSLVAVWAASTPGVSAQTSSQCPVGASPASLASSASSLDLSLPTNGYEAVVAVARKGKWACSGALIASDRVLTAAHCFPATHIMLGEDVERPQQVLRVTGGSPHPGADVAVLRLEKPVTTVTPLIFRTAKDSSPPLGSVHHVGFGAHDVRGRLGFGRKHPTSFAVSGWGCHQGNAKTFGCKPGLELVVKATPGLDTCRGDSGGPLLELVSDDGRCSWRIFGTTSRSVATAKVACGQGGIYVRADRIAHWIEQQLGSSVEKKDTE